MMKTPFPALRKNRGALLRTALMAAALAAAGSAHADYVWLERDGGQWTARAGELDAPLANLPALQDARAVSSDGQAGAVQAAGNAFALPSATAGDQRFAATLAGNDGILTYYQARFGRSETKAVHDLELVPTEPEGDTYRLLFKGRPVAASQVNVATSEGWRRVLRPAKDGSVSFKPWFPGLYVLEVTAQVNNGSVSLHGKTYKDVRHTATLSFEVRP